MFLRRACLFAAHAALAVAIVGLLYGQLSERREAVAEVQRAADQERLETERMQRENDVRRGLLQGLRSNDPYVVEMLARERLRYGRPGEIAPPPLPAIDKTP